MKTLTKFALAAAILACAGFTANAQWGSGYCYSTTTAYSYSGYSAYTPSYSSSYTTYRYTPSYSSKLHHVLLHPELQLRLKLRQLLGLVQRLWQQHPNRRDDLPQLFFIRRRVPYRDHNHRRKKFIYHALRPVNRDDEVRPLDR